MNGIPEDKYSICSITGLRVCEIFSDLQVREDGFVRYIGAYTARSHDWLTYKPKTNGYISVAITRPNKRIWYGIHRLVAKAFVSTDDHTLMVDHKDGNRSNNNATNIRWCTNRENQWNSKRHRAGRLWCASLVRTRWRAYVNMFDGTKRYIVHVGYFSTELDAHQASCKYADEHGIQHPPMQTE